MPRVGEVSRQILEEAARRPSRRGGAGVRVRVDDVTAREAETGMTALGVTSPCDAPRRELGNRSAVPAARCWILRELRFTARAGAATTPNSLANRPLEPRGRGNRTLGPRDDSARWGVVRGIRPRGPSGDNPTPAGSSAALPPAPTRRPERRDGARRGSRRRRGGSGGPLRDRPPWARRARSDMRPGSRWCRGARRAAPPTPAARRRPSDSRLPSSCPSRSRTSRQWVPPRAPKRASTRGSRSRSRTASPSSVGETIADSRDGVEVETCHAPSDREVESFCCAERLTRQVIRVHDARPAATSRSRRRG